MDTEGLWKILVPDYGLTDSGRLCYLASYEALTLQSGFCRSRFEPPLYFRDHEDKTLVFFVQGYDYMYAGTALRLSHFQTFMQNQFRVKTVETQNFENMRARLSESDAGAVVLDVPEQEAEVTSWNSRLRPGAFCSMLKLT